MIELIKAFKDIKYTDPTHTYSSNGKSLISITQLINKFKEKFNTEYWTTIKAYQFSGCVTKQKWMGKSYDPNCFYADGVCVYLTDDHSYLPVTPEQVKAQWQQDSLIGTTRGTYCHNYLENLEKGIIDKPSLIIPKGLSTLKTISYLKSIELVDNLCHSYLKDHPYLIPALIEFRVGDENLGIAGTFDRLYYNEKSEQYEIWDFKTDKEIKLSNKYQKLKFFDVDDCEFNKYGVQTSFYKYLIEKNTSQVLGDSHIVHINLKEERVDIHKCIDFTNKLKNEDWTTYCKY
jgi:hypothetical protein